MWRLNAEQEALREEIRSVVRSRIQPRVREIDESQEYPHDLYGVMRDADLLGLSVPPEYGGRCSPHVSWGADLRGRAQVSGPGSPIAGLAKLVSLPPPPARPEEQ